MKFTYALLLSSLCIAYANAADFSSEICRSEVKGEVVSQIIFYTRDGAYLPEMTVSITNLSGDKILYVPEGVQGAEDWFVNVWRVHPTPQPISSYPPAPPALIAPSAPPGIVPGSEDGVLKTPGIAYENREARRAQTVLAPQQSWTRQIDWRTFVPMERRHLRRDSHRYDLSVTRWQNFWRDRDAHAENSERRAALTRAEQMAKCGARTHVAINWDARR